MSDLAAQVRNLDKSFNELKSLVTRLLPSPDSRRNMRKQKAKPPPWAQDIMVAISRLSEQFLEVKEAVGEPRFGCNHDHNTGADDRGATPDGHGQSTTTTLPNMSKQSENGRWPLKESSNAAASAHCGDLTMANGEAPRGDGLESTRNGSLTPRDQVSKTQSHATGRPLSSQDSDEAGSVETSRETTPDPIGEPALPNQQVRPRRKSTFSLSVQDMGERLVANAMKFTADPAFSDCISIKNLPEIDWANLATSIQPPPKDYDLLGVMYSTTPAVAGAAELRLSPSTRFCFPDFSKAIQKPSIEECLNDLNQLIENPPGETIPYYVGPPLHDGPLMSMVNSLLHPGQELLRLGAVNGMNSVYWHAGKKGSGTAFHCEDLDSWSFNLVLKGWKLWIKIRPEHSAKFEAFIRKNWPTNKCDQFVRHTSIIVSPERLQKENIDFDTFLTGPGDLELTYPRGYHMVVNMTDNFAVAINFLPPGKPIVPQYTRACPECGLFSLRHRCIRKVPYAPATAAELNPHCKPGRGGINSNSRSVDKGNPSLKSTPLARRKRKITDEAVQLQGRAKRTKQHSDSQDLKDLDAEKARIRGIDKRCKFPSLEGDLPTKAVFSAVSAIWSRMAIDQYCSLVRSTRDIHRHSVRIDVCGDLPTRMEQRVRRLMISQRRSKLEIFLCRLDQLRLVEEIENSKEEEQRLIADPAFIKGILDNTGMTRVQLKAQRTQGNIWKKLCHGDEGLLCFIPLEGSNTLGVTMKTYTQMTPDDLKMFSKLLDCDYTKSVCTAGRAFLDAFNSNAPDADFCWEGGNFDVYKLPEKELLTSLQPFPSVTEDNDSDKYTDWPRPPEWPEEWRWPVDPTTLVDPNGRQCDFCSETNCSCISVNRRPMPRIKDYGKQGRGLQAVANEPGQTAYKDGDRIGELKAKIAPLGTYKDGQTLELVRGDHFTEPAVCQIHCAEEGNYFRLLNHHCRPNARFQGRIVSGRYRMMVMAVRDIQDGEQITTDYGPGYWGEKGCPCDAHTDG